jgi:hypothetical protein
MNLFGGVEGVGMKMPVLSDFCEWLGERAFDVTYKKQ